MIDPETARQAVTDWYENRYTPAGDALAVLVPQLLDQLAVEEMKADTWATEAIAAAKCEEAARAERDALESEKAQLLDQLAARTLAAQGLKNTLDTVWAQRDALGERCHQLETALARTQEKNDRQAVTVAQAYDKCMVFAAALREIAERDSVVLMGRPRYGVFGKIARAALGDTPPREKPSLGIGTNTTVGRGDAAVSPEPRDAWTHYGHGDTLPVVEPPQPSPTDETCHHGRPFDLCAICSARIPYERPPQPETDDVAWTDPAWPSRRPETEGT